MLRSCERVNGAANPSADFGALGRAHGSWPTHPGPSPPIGARGLFCLFSRLREEMPFSFDALRTNGKRKRESRSRAIPWIPARARYAGLAGMTARNMRRISTTRHYCLIAIIPVTSFPQSLSGNSLILLDTRFRGYDGLCTLTFTSKRWIVFSVIFPQFELPPDS